MNNLSNVKSGDKVFLHHRSGTTVVTVTKVGKSHVSIGDYKYRIRSGVRTGNGWYQECIETITPESQARVDAAHAKRVMWNRVVNARDKLRDVAFGVETVEIVEKFLEDINGYYTRTQSQAQSDGNTG